MISRQISSNRALYDNIVSRIAMFVPMFAKAIVDAALEEAGLDPFTVTPSQMKELIDKEIFPRIQKYSRGVNSFSEMSAAAIYFSDTGQVTGSTFSAERILKIDSNTDAGCKQINEFLSKHDALDILSEKIRNNDETVFIKEIQDEKLKLIMTLTGGIIKEPHTNKLCGAVIFIEDITLKTRLMEELESTLRTSNRKLQDIFDNANDGILIADIETMMFIDGNKSICNMLGYTLDEITGMGVMDIHPEKDLPYVQEQFEKQARKEIQLAKDMPFLRKDGTVFYADVNSSPVEIAGKMCLMGICRDMTEKRKIEKANAELQKKLFQSSKMSAIGQLAGGVAHEINNPVGIILGFSESIVKRTSEDDPLYMPLKSIEREAVRCRTLIGNLLTFSRSGGTEKEHAEVYRLIENPLSLIEAQLKSSNITVEKKINKDLPLIFVNKNQVEQVIMNLCNNAIDAMPGGGQLLVSAASEESGGGKKVKITVSDTGNGIPEELQEKVFEPFFTTKEVGKGTGLGLSLSYDIVEQNNGTIELISEAGKGTKFIIKFSGVTANE